MSESQNISVRLHSLGQKLLVGHREVPRVPKDPKHQAKKDDDGPREDEQIPVLDGCKNPHQEDDQSGHVAQNGQKEKEETTSDFLRAFVHAGHLRDLGWWEATDVALADTTEARMTETFFLRSYKQQLTCILTQKI